MKENSKFCLPLKLKNQQNSFRHVGYELEFAGLGLVEVADALCRSMSGTAIHETKAESRVVTEKYGDFLVELDWKLGKEIARDAAKEKVNLPVAQQADSKMLDMLAKLVRQIVPVEVVCPPISVNELSVLDLMVEELRLLGALGTQESVVYAFGVHINAELPDLSVQTIVRYLKAFCLAQKWLYQAHRVDFSRRVTPYIDAYPEDYVDLVLAYDSRIEMDVLIDDYLNFNSTRNRGLDLLPLLKYLSPTRILAAIEDPRVNARPTFHYRLPNCEIEKENWSLSDSWNVWCVVEHLAFDDQAVIAMTEERRIFKSNLWNLSREPWHFGLDQIYQNLLSV